MLKLKNHVSFLLTFYILTLSMTFTANIHSNVNQSNLDNIQYEFVNIERDPLHLDVASSVGSDASDSLNPNHHTIVFVENKIEFQLLKKLHQSSIIKSYDNLMALKFNLPKYIVEKEIGSDEITIFTAQAFENFNIPVSDQLWSKSKSFQLTQESPEAIFLGIDTLWDDGYNGTGVNVAVMDNGIDFTHPALSNKIIESYDISTNDTLPCQEHGTPVAGLIAADYNTNVPGMAHGSKLYDISFGCRGSTISGDILAGFDYILENNATIDVVNTSFGGFAPSWDFIVEKLESAGIILVGSSGNEGPAFHSTSTGGPGNSIHGISVGSSDFNTTLSTFSSRGPVYSMLYKPDLIAPGVDITSITNLGGYGNFFGTSFSSPIVAGGVSTLLSGLNSLGINWNPGVIKASLLNTARNITNNELLDGQGIANFTKAFDLIITSNVGLNNTPQLVSLTPKYGPIKYVSTIPQGMILNVPLTLISSHPDDVIISFTDDLNGITTVSRIDKLYSQKIELQIDTSSISPGSTLMGNVVATLNGTTAISQILINVGEAMIGKIGIDLGHTYWDDIGANGIGSSNTGEMIRLAMLEGYGVEHVNEEINQTILNEFDIFWMPDPNSWMNTDSPSLFDQGFQQNPLFDSEITAIVNYVNSGGSLLIDFNGQFSSSDNSTTVTLTGLNATGMNHLIDNFGILASTEPFVEPIGQISVNLINESSLIGLAEKYTHYGNYLQLSKTAEPLAITKGGQITAATYSNPNSGGRVIVSSTNYWLDNTGILGGYIGAGSNNKILAKNSLHWLTENKRVIKTIEDIANNEISGSFTLIKNKTLSNESPIVNLESNKWVAFQSINPIDHGNGTFSFAHSFSGEGIHRIIASYGDDYMVWAVTVDTESPTIIPNMKNPNGTIFDEATFYLIEFEVEDDISGVNEETFEIYLDNIQIFPDLTFRDQTGSLVVLIRSEELQMKESGEFYQLDVVVSDLNSNTALFSYYFQIGIAVISSDSSLTSSSIADNGKEGDTNLIVENLEIIIFIGLTSIILFLTYKNYQLRKSNK